MPDKHKELDGVSIDCRAESGPGRAIVVFRDATEIRWLRVLKRGFRHCAILVEAEKGWILCDALSHKTVLKQVYNRSSESVVACLAAAGLHALEVRLQTPPERMAPILPFTCVEAVKRIVGIHAWWIVTPWQLYQHLMQNAKFIFDNDPKTEY